MEKNKIIYSEILCVFAFSLMPACSCRLCLCQMEGFIREVEILENRTNRMFGMGLVVMGIIASYFCESSGFSYIYYLCCFGRSVRGRPDRVQDCPAYPDSRNSMDMQNTSDP